MKLLRIINIISVALFITASCIRDNNFVPEVPVAVLTSINGLQMNSVTLNGKVDPNSFSTIVFFEYGNSESYGDTARATPGTITGNTKTAVTANIKNLFANTLYHYRLKTLNAVGVSFSPDSVFTTLGSVPSSTELKCETVSISSAKLTVVVNANGFKTSILFDYGTTTDYGLTFFPEQDTLTGNRDIRIEIEITGLSPNTSYHCRMIAVNELGTVTGSDCSFITLGNIPEVATLSSEGVETDKVILNASINPGLLPTDVVFEYGPTAEYGYSIANSGNPLSGNTDTLVNVQVSGLSVGTVYHYRVKATNSIGTSFGNDSIFSTLGKIPFVYTLSVANLKADNVILQAVVNPEYLETTVGFEYGLTTQYGNTLVYNLNPLIGNTSKNVTMQLKGLTNWTTYHYRVTATNMLGTVFGNDTSFTTLGTVSDIDGNIYLVTVIGTQTWMAENLKVKTLTDNTSVPYISDDAQWSALSTPAYSSVNGNSVTYGLLYNWFTVQTGKLCPTGWHIPSTEEWDSLAENLGGEKLAGGKLKETGTGHWTAPNAGATNESGFNARPGGFRNKSGSYYYLNNFGYFWTSDEFDSDNAWFRNLAYSTTNLNSGKALKSQGQSVRCIKE
jgi:uncharacterized protein (TIGR02145 family)